MRPPVDMSGEAIATRITELSRLSLLDDPFRPRVDMSGEAIARRIHDLSEMSRLCASLGQAGDDWRVAEAKAASVASASPATRADHPQGTTGDVSHS